MLNHGEPVIKGFADLRREIDLAKGLEIGEFSVSAGPYPAEISAQRAIGMLSAQHPRLFVELKLFNWTKIVNQVLNERIASALPTSSKRPRTRNWKPKPSEPRG